MEKQIMYQVSTLQALAMGYSRSIVTVEELLEHGGHVFDLALREGTMKCNKISQIRIQLPTSPAFDTYSLKQASQDEIREVEQGK